MTEDQNIQQPEPLTLKRVGLFLKEKGITVKPLPESTDVVETIQVEKKDLLKVSRLLKEDKDTLFDLLISVSAVDKIDEGLLESVYHLFSTKYYHMLVMKVQTSKEKPSIPSVVSIWTTADWHERESYDLMGITYDGHPDLKRILMPADWIGYPLRKDYTMNDERLVWNER